MARRLGTVRLHEQPSNARLCDHSLRALADERIQAAYERGRRDGAREAVESGAAALESALEHLDTAAERAQDELASQAVELSVSIARELLKVRIEANELDLERIVRGALGDSEVGRGNVVVHLHPDDHALLEGVLFRAGTELAVDPSLPRGDVHLSTPRGLLVRELEAALTSIREQLLEDLV